MLDSPRASQTIGAEGRPETVDNSHDVKLCRKKADHITMVRSWDQRILKTIEGNATELSFEAEKMGQAVVINRRDLSDPVGGPVDPSKSGPAM